MLTAELPLFAKVKVNQAVPVPTGVLPKFWLAGLRVRVWAINANGAMNENTSRTSTRLQNRLTGTLLCFICSSLIRGTPDRAIRPRLGDGRKGGAKRHRVGRIGEIYSYIALARAMSEIFDNT